MKTESRAIENQYPTMSLDEVCGLGPQIAEDRTDDCVLFLWVTTPKCVEAVQVLDAWGFTYRTGAVWDKQKIGMGYYVRQRSEMLFIGAKGKITTPPPEARPDSIISYPRRKHSQKPDEVYEIIEKMYPGLPKVELFARNEREGWDAWGNEIERGD